jgi:hypothetical protein
LSVRSVPEEIAEGQGALLLKLRAATSLAPQAAGSGLLKLVRRYIR